MVNKIRPVAWHGGRYYVMYYTIFFVKKYMLGNLNGKADLQSRQIKPVVGQLA